jgi:fused signal recognition particle receptor
MFDFLKKSVQSFTTKVKKTVSPAPPQEKREIKASISFGTQLKKAVVGKTTIKEKDIADLLEELELALLEGDVEQSTAKAITEGMKEKLVGLNVMRREDISAILKTKIKETLEEIISVPSLDLEQLTAEKKPLKILFLGPNGAGKTTSIAKIAHYFKQHGKSVILAAGDTFRAASIEQLQVHANKLEVRMIHHQYGSDPAAVAFDAIKAAEANKIDVVLIDSAGRQDTNKNLMNELKKIDRVAQPDIKLFVGESFAGQTFLQQAQEFDKEIGVDGFVITKLDADAKGGTTISLIHVMKKPIVFMGMGQEYEDITVFDKKDMIDRVVG